jgi:hypothetical protein
VIAHANPDGGDETPGPAATLLREQPLTPVAALRHIKGTIWDGARHRRAIAEERIGLKDPGIGIGLHESQNPVVGGRLPGDRLAPLVMAPEF